MTTEQKVRKAAYDKQYRQDHRPEIAVKKKQYRQDNKPEVTAQKKRYNRDHKPEKAAYDKQYRQDHRPEAAAYQKQYRQDHKLEEAAYGKKYRQDHKPEKAVYDEQYYQGHKPEKAVYHRGYQRNRRVSDIDYRLKTNFTNRIGQSIKGTKQYKHSADLLGCTPEYAHEHLERQFKEGMTWDNYGPHGWHIDHIIPLDSFDFTDYEQQKRAWYYANLRPLWAEENIKKGNKIIEIQLILI